jgi:hypothetical protein
MNAIRNLSLRAGLVLMSATAFAERTLGANFAGPIPSIPGTPSAASEGDIRGVILKALAFVLNFLALLAVVFIVISGVRLIISQGNDEQKDKAKKTILYVIIGLLVVLFARVIVGFFTTTIAQTF